LKEQAGKDIKYIEKLNLSDPNKALQILVDIRAILLEKKISLES